MNVLYLAFSAALLVGGCSSKKAEHAEWWRYEAGASAYPVGQMVGLLQPLNGGFRLREDGSYDSEGFVGKGTWKDDGDRIVLTPVGDAPAAQIFQSFPNVRPPAPPIVLTRHDRELRIYTEGYEGKKPWLGFVRYEPTAEEAARGPRKKKELPFDENSPEWRPRIQLALAIQGENVAAVRAAIRQGANLEGPRPSLKRLYGFGFTPLGLAVSLRRADVAEVLLQAGANPDALLEGEGTPLMTAAQNGDAACIRVLLKHRASKLLKSPTGKTALDYARARGHPEVEPLLK